MNNETGDLKQSVDETEIDNDNDNDEIETDVEVPEETVVLDEAAMSTDNVGDVSVEINVEELVATIEAEEDEDAARKKEIRRRLEDAVEDQAFEDTYAIDLGEQSD